MTVDISATITDANLANWEKELIVVAEVARIEAQRDEALAMIDTVREQRDFARSEVRALKQSLQDELRAFAENHLDSGDQAYADLHELMIQHELEGLTRKFTATVRVTFEFEVEVEATDEDSAREEIDNNITTHIHENVSLYDYPDDYDIDNIEEA